MKLEGLITLYTAVMNLGELVKRLNLLFLVVVAGEILFLYSCWKSNQLAFVAGAQKGRGGGGGGGVENWPQKCPPVLQWYGNPHSQNSSDMGILFSYYLSDLGQG